MRSWFLSVLVLSAFLVIALGYRPVLAAPKDVTIKLETIKVVDEADGSGNAEPYLWVLFFKLDAATAGFLKGNTWLPWLSAPTGTHGNLGGDGDWDSGEKISIPVTIGVWTTSLSDSSTVPAKGRGVGALVTLLEEDALPSSSDIRQYHAQFVSIAKVNLGTWYARYAALLRYVTAVAPSADTLLSFLDKAVEPLFHSALQDPWFTWLLPPLIGPTLYDIDDYIGHKLLFFPWDDMSAKTGTKSFTLQWNSSTGSEDGDFELHGHMAWK